MGVQYILVNESKKELISFKHLDGSKKRELAGNAAQSSIVTWYLLQNTGDNIQFVTDTHDDWPFTGSSRQDLNLYLDKTEGIIEDLIVNEVLGDFGKSYVDGDDPENIYVRDIRNVWCK